jgi:hypothetical protein
MQWTRFGIIELQFMRNMRFRYAMIVTSEEMIT